MEYTFNYSVYAVRLPIIIAFIVLFYMAIKGIKNFLWKHLSEQQKYSLTRFYDFFDPYHQSIFCYQYKWVSALIIIGLIYLFCWLYIPPQYIYDDKGLYIATSVLRNPAVYLLNYLTHENLGHNLFCPISPKWFCYFSGSFMEILIPSIIYLFSLRLRGGIFFSPILLYWLASALYSVGVYASDAQINQLALTSSDMVTDFAGGAVKGDWYYILEPFNALSHAQSIGFIFEISACVVLALAIYSFREYIRHLLQKNISDIM